jgi:hypothetical protein
MYSEKGKNNVDKIILKACQHAKAQLFFCLTLQKNIHYEQLCPSGRGNHVVGRKRV